MTSAWTNGSTRQWRRVRAAVLARDLGQCQLRLAGCTVTATCVHHTYGRLVTGDDLRYLVASCRMCNLRVGQPGRRGQRRRAPRRVVYSRW